MKMKLTIFRLNGMDMEYNDIDSDYLSWVVEVCNHYPDFVGWSVSYGN